MRDMIYIHIYINYTVDKYTNIVTDVCDTIIKDIKKEIFDK